MKRCGRVASRITDEDISTPFFQAVPHNVAVFCGGGETSVLSCSGGQTPVLSLRVIIFFCKMTGAVVPHKKNVACSRVHEPQLVSSSAVSAAPVASAV